jgi:UDP-N-acetylmuramoylalanine-D-glutamate ligase
MAPRKPDSEVDVLIIGAGPAGLMMANWMSRFGVKTRIVDKRGTKAMNPPPSIPEPPTNSIRYSTAKLTGLIVGPSRSWTHSTLATEL